jgi:hypothetical protein
MFRIVLVLAYTNLQSKSRNKTTKDSNNWVSLNKKRFIIKEGGKIW